MPGGQPPRPGGSSGTPLGVGLVSAVHQGIGLVAQSSGSPVVDSLSLSVLVSVVLVSVVLDVSALDVSVLVPLLDDSLPDDSLPDDSLSDDSLAVPSSSVLRPAGAVQASSKHDSERARRIMTRRISRHHCASVGSIASACSRK
jgi:hypothetical protein